VISCAGGRNEFKTNLARITIGKHTHTHIRSSSTCVSFRR
jgi:hypothetical protein